MFRRRTGIQLAVPFEERRLLNRGRFKVRWSPPYLIQPKLDGERCRAIVTRRRVLLLSSTDAVIPTLPHLNKALQALPSGEYDGELYRHGWPLNKIQGVISTTTHLHPDSEGLNYHIFDLVDESKPQWERLNILLSLKLSPPLEVVNTKIVTTQEEITRCYDQYLAEGYEGFILRHFDAYYVRRRVATMLKFKPKAQDIYPVVGLNEAISQGGTHLKMVGSFVCRGKGENSSEEFSVGAGHLTHQERVEVWKRWEDQELTGDSHSLLLEYQALTPKRGVPYFSRALKLIKRKDT